jgi:hypothetical protein
MAVATSRAQNPAGSFSPPLSGSHAGPDLVRDCDETCDDRNSATAQNPIAPINETRVRNEGMDDLLNEWTFPTASSSVHGLSCGDDKPATPLVTSL